jgi:hypothetical protein
VHESAAVKLTSYPGTVRQLIVTGLGRDAPTVISTNDHDITTRALIGQYARLGPGYHAPAPDTLQRRFLDTPVPWWGNRQLHFEFT